jgi:hypothetical protein
MGHGSVRTCSSPFGNFQFFSMTFERFGCENKTKGKQKRTKDEQLILSNTDTLLG